MFIGIYSQFCAVIIYFSMKDLSEVASVSGKGGLFRVLKPGRAGVILESLDARKQKMVTTPNHKVSILAEISLYTTTEEGSLPLEDIFRKIHKEFGDDPGVDSKSTPDELMSFIEYLVPEYDDQRVYPSDVRKLVNWYHILLKEAPELLKEPKKDKADDAADEKEEGQGKKEKNTTKEKSSPKSGDTSQKAKTGKTSSGS